MWCPSCRSQSLLMAVSDIGPVVRAERRGTPKIRYARSTANTRPDAIKTGTTWVARHKGATLLSDEQAFQLGRVLTERVAGVSSSYLEVEWPHEGHHRVLRWMSALETC